MLVKGGDDCKFAKLAGGILARAERELPTELDAMGDTAISNAVKAVALANNMSENRGSPAALAFTSSLLSSKDNEGNFKRLVRLSIRGGRLPASQRADEPRDFSAGGIYVPVGPESAGPRASAAKAEGDGKQPHVATAGELARIALGQWLNFADPERHAERRRVATEAAGAKAKQAPENATVGRKSAPFMVTMGPKALSRAVKALAFAHGDLQKEYFAGSPDFLVVPRFGLHHKRDKFTGEVRTSKLVALCLLRATPEKKK